MNTLEIIEIVKALQKYYDMKVVMIDSIIDYYDTIVITTLYAETLIWNRETKNLSKKGE